MILDCFGLMHAADQRAALAERAARLAPGGVLLLQYHALSTIIRQRAVERAAARALRVLLDDRADRHAGRGRLQPAHRLAVRPLRRHRAAGRDPGRRRAAASRTTSVRSLLAETPRRCPRSRRASPACSAMCRPTLRPCMTGWRPSDPPDARCSATAPPPGRSRCCARRTWIATLLPAVADASPAKQGLRMPGTDIPVVEPGRARRSAGRTRCCCSSRTCWPRSGRPTRRSRPQAAGGWTPRHLAHEACSRTRSRARHVPGWGRCCRSAARARSDISA